MEESKKYLELNGIYGNIKASIKNTEDRSEISFNFFSVIDKLEPYIASIIVSATNNYIDPIYKSNQLNCSGNREKEEICADFVFTLDEKAYSDFINNKEIDAQDKFSCLLSKYINILMLPDEFKEIKDQELNLFYDNYIKILKECGEYIKLNGGIRENNRFFFTNIFSSIIDKVFSKPDNNQENNINFIINTFNSIPDIIKDKDINFQGQPLLNRTIQRFLEVPNNNNIILLDFFKEIFSKNPNVIYDFSTTSDIIKKQYDSIEKNGFEGNFICNFPDIVMKDGNISYSDRCEPNILSEILVALKRDGIQIKDKQNLIAPLLINSLDVLSKQINSLKNENNTAELQKIHFLLNCPVKDPNTKEIKTPLDFLQDFTSQENEILNKEQRKSISKKIEFLKQEPIGLKTMEEIKDSEKFKEIMEVKKTPKERLDYMITTMNSINSFDKKNLEIITDIAEQFMSLLSGMENRILSEEQEKNKTQKNKIKKIFSRNRNKKEIKNKNENIEGIKKYKNSINTNISYLKNSLHQIKDPNIYNITAKSYKNSLMKNMLNYLEIFPEFNEFAEQKKNEIIPQQSILIG